MYLFYHFGITITLIYTEGNFICVLKIDLILGFVKFDWILFLIENLVVTNVWHGGDGRSWR